MRMSKGDLRKYQQWMADYSPMCQRCESAPADNLHHLRYGCYGANKDDTTLIAVCLPCHQWFHQNKRKGIDAYEATAIENYETYIKEEHVI